MFSLAGNMKFITLDQNYIKELHNACSEVYYKPSNYDDKPYFGILLNANGRTYAIPLSSAKPKHKTWKNINQECYLVYEYAEKSKIGKNSIWTETDDPNLVKHILSIIDIKKMIPVKEGTYSIVNLNKSLFDTLREEKYKDLLNKEYSFCLKNIDSIIVKDSKLYGHQMATGKVKKFCCDFKMLEDVCDNYEVAILV